MAIPRQDAYPTAVNHRYLGQRGMMLRGSVKSSTLKYDNGIRRNPSTAKE